MGVGFGGGGRDKGMINTDMIIFTYFNGKAGVRDTFSTKNANPDLDTQDDLKDVNVQYSVSKIPVGTATISCVRKFDTGDVKQDKVINLDEMFNIVWAYANLGDMKAHSLKNMGWFKIMFNKDGTMSS